MLLSRCCVYLHSCFSVLKLYSFMPVPITVVQMPQYYVGRHAIDYVLLPLQAAGAWMQFYSCPTALIIFSCYCCRCVTPETPVAWPSVSVQVVYLF